MGRIFNKAIFVPKVIPEETVRVKVLKEKPGYSIGELIEVVKPAKERILPPCPYSDQCGGCDYQHIKYSSQLTFKEDILQETLERVGGLKRITVNPIIPSPDPFNYRLKTQLKLSGDNDRIKVGYFKKDSHRLVPVKECIICHKEINNLIKAILELRDHNLLYKLDEIDITLSALTGKFLLTLYGRNIDRKHLENIHLSLLEINNNISGLLSPKKKKVLQSGKSYIREKIKGLAYRVSYASFFQVNNLLRETLLKEIMSITNPKKKDNIFDIYCGAGMFTLPLSLKANHVIGIDDSNSSINDALSNKRANKVKNCDFVEAKAEEGLQMLKKRKNPCDTILINPPRGGCTERVKNLITSFIPKNIIYLSCNPSTLARDLSVFVEKGYEIKTIQPIDFFPQTYHIETLVKLEKL